MISSAWGKRNSGCASGCGQGRITFGVFPFGTGVLPGKMSVLGDRVYIIFTISPRRQGLWRSYPHSPQFFPQAVGEKQLKKPGGCGNLPPGIHRGWKTCGCFFCLHNVFRAEMRPHRKPGAFLCRQGRPPGVSREKNLQSVCFFHETILP